LIELFATPQQQEVINCTARYIGFFGSRRFGKTDTFFNRCLKRCLSEAIEYVYLSPDYGLAKEQYERIEASLSDHGLVRRAVGQPKPKIELATGSRIHFRSFDNPRRMRGLRRITEIFVDEIQNIKEAEFWAVLRPLVSDVQGTIIVAGQFRGHNWYYKKFYEKGQVPGQNLYKSWRFPWQDAFVFQSAAGQEDIRQAMADMPKAQFDVEYNCLPIANIAAVFLPEDLQAIQRGSVLASPRSGVQYILAYDLGEMHDPSALVVYEHVTKTVVWAETIPLRTKHEQQARTLAQKARFWNDAQVIIDGTGGAAGGQKATDENVKFYRQFIPDVRVLVWQPGFKRELIRTLSLAIEGHKISIPKELEDLHTQLAAYEFKRKGGDSEEYTYGAGEGGHDDQVAALMMAEHASKCGWVKNPNAMPMYTGL
jgi:hypothetical protein